MRKLIGIVSVLVVAGFWATVAEAHEPSKVESPAVGAASVISCDGGRVEVIKQSINNLSQTVVEGSFVTIDAGNLTLDATGNEDAFTVTLTGDANLQGAVTADFL